MVDHFRDESVSQSQHQPTKGARCSQWCRRLYYLSPPPTTTNNPNCNNVNIPLNALSALITKIVLALGSIDEIINICRPNATIDNLSPEVLLTVALELSADESEDNFLYKGFRLEIETKIYSDVVNQNRAIGINQSGITMITTEYSFASDPNVLINELKFIIDRDGLKSY